MKILLENDLVGIIAIVLCLLVAVLGMLLVASNLKRKEDGFGPNSTRAFAISLFVPIVIVAAVVSDLGSEAIATLLGTLAGYIFSKTGEDK
ncbi:hypothetical protein [Ascidiaceihabitans sp.]|uniref:hypothetical protein n=1 Tax=Ascidiaceihabitans sp. TaxID=1872644 RepID=UPI003299630D